MQRVSPRAIDLNIILHPDAARAVAEWAAWSGSDNDQVISSGQGQVLQYNIAEANGGKEKERESV